MSSSSASPPVDSSLASPASSPSEDFSLGPLLRFAWRAVRVNAIPGFALQCIALLIVILYYSSSSAQSAFEAIGRARDSLSWGFSPLINFFAGGVIPGLFLSWKEYKLGVNLLERKPVMLVEILFLSFFWSYKGFEVDCFYKLQAALFGTGPQFSVIAPKVFVDQFIYNPLWGCHSVTIPYLWKSQNFNFQETKKRLDKKFWYFQTPATLISTWSVWFPAVSLIYCMPSALQIPLFSIVLCFWSIVLAFSQSDKAGQDETTSAENKLPHESEADKLELAGLAAQVDSNQSELAFKLKIKQIENAAENGEESIIMTTEPASQAV
jgi:hypothetical protein